MQASRPSHSIHSASRRVFSFVTLTILVLFAWPPAAAQAATPTIHLEGDLTDDGKLRIGGHLDVALADGVPFFPYTVLLVDEAEDKVAAIYLTTDAFGKTANYRLWTRTGVVGCDPGAVHDPLSYHFESFSEAESVLGGRTFRVLVAEDPDDPFGTELAATDLDLAAVPAFLEAYPSDAAGCLRTVLGAGRPLHLAVSHQRSVAVDLEVFVVDHQDVWLPGMPLVDVRGASQMISVPAGADPWVEFLGTAATAGDYQIILRFRPNEELEFDLKTDLLAETGFAIIGTTNTECTGVCPP